MPTGFFLNLANYRELSQTMSVTCKPTASFPSHTVHTRWHSKAANTNLDNN